MIGVVRDAFHRPGTRAYAIVQTIIWSLIVVSVALLVVEFAVEVAPAVERGLAAADRVILWIFAVELVLRVGSYRPRALDLFDLGPVGRLREHVVGRLRFTLRPMILIDVLTVSALVPALRGLRALRLLRLVRTATGTRSRDSTGRSGTTPCCSPSRCRCWAPPCCSAAARSTWSRAAPTRTWTS